VKTNLKVVSPDDNSTWSEELTDFIESKSAKYDFETNVFGNDDDDRLRSLIAPNHVLVYHATKLLPHEITLIESDGLMPLTPELVELKINHAVLSDFLTDWQGEELLNGSSFRTRADEQRSNQICLILGCNVLYENHSGFTKLLNIWGGESINHTDAGEKHERHLMEIGIPAIIKLGIPVGPDVDLGQDYPLRKPFYGNFLKRPESITIRWEGSLIPSEWILDILKPGDFEFDAFNLPIGK
jgi:hypothetical protein